MREALARTDHDFILSEEPPPAPRGGFAVIVAIAGFVWRLVSYPSRVLGALVFGLTVAILVNALLLQHSRHPAPLFHKSMPVAAVPAPAPPPAAVAPPPAPARPAESAAVAPPQDPIARLLTNDPSPAQSAQHGEPHGDTDTEADQRALSPNRRPSAAPAPTPPKDPINELLKETPRAQPPAETQPAEDRSKTVLGVQKALLKLGYVVRPDGEMGAVTKHALEQYARDHGLPAPVTLTPKLLRRLATESGVTIE